MAAIFAGPFLWLRPIRSYRAARERCRAPAFADGKPFGQIVSENFEPGRRSRAFSHGRPRRPEACSGPHKLSGRQTRGRCLVFLDPWDWSGKRPICLEVDFAPYFIFIACVVTSVRLPTLRRKAWGQLATTGVAALLLYSIVTDLALAVQGPYDQFVQANPRSYTELARWFSPVARYRPLLNPGLWFRATTSFPCHVPRERSH
jgi:hypothetical protein